MTITIGHGMGRPAVCENHPDRPAVSMFVGAHGKPRLFCDAIACRSEAARIARTFLR